MTITTLSIITGITLFGVLPLVIACRGAGSYRLLAFGFSFFTIARPFVLGLEDKSDVFTFVLCGIAALAFAAQSRVRPLRKIRTDR
jgi:hypothetical protein